MGAVPGAVLLDLAESRLDTTSALVHIPSHARQLASDITTTSMPRARHKAPFATPQFDWLDLCPDGAAFGIWPGTRTRQIVEIEAVIGCSDPNLYQLTPRGKFS